MAACPQLSKTTLFIARLTYEPNDIHIFGRAIALHPCAEFVASSMANGVSLNELMDALGANSFAPTQRNALRGEGNFDPRKAYRQQAAVELSGEGLSWLRDRLQAAFEAHGTMPQGTLDNLDWPALPLGPSTGNGG
ncbi:MAG: hypothetical protein WBW73_06155 [Rhodoplanes sp.]